MKLKLTPLVATVGAVLLTVGCTFPSSRRTVSARSANIMQTVEVGTVTNVREVNIEGTKGPIGMFGGGALGSAAASGGSGVGGAMARAGGAVVGAVAGMAVEEKLTRKTAQEITVHLDDGRTVVVTQSADGGLYRDGDRVRILNGGGVAAVTMDVAAR